MKRHLWIVLLFFVSADTANKADNTNGGESGYVLVFSDEFNLPNGSLPSSEYWSCSRRGNSTWDRWISDIPDVACVFNGCLVCRAIANTMLPADTALMLTGAVETKGKFSFQHGKIEVRARTNLHEGNFPAIWLMPEPPAPRHPFGGEIDIFESYGTHKDAKQTIHTNWTLNLKQNNNPRNHFAKNHFDISRWHVYGLEWTPTSLVFLIDGNVTGFYRKSDDTEALANGQWPFDHPFYIILNQSLRRFGTFGGDPDMNYVYETHFDWVRVYQEVKAK